MKKAIVITALAWTILGLLAVLSSPDEFIVWSLFYSALLLSTCIFYLQDSSNFLGLKRGIVIGTLVYTIISVLFCISDPEEGLLWTLAYFVVVLASQIIYLVDRKEGK